MKAYLTFSLLSLLISGQSLMASDDRNSTKLSSLGQKFEVGFSQATRENDERIMLPQARFVTLNPHSFLFSTQVNLIGSNLRIEKSVVPAAPFEFGSPDDQPDPALASIFVKNADVPVAPFNYGDASDFPELIGND